MGRRRERDDAGCGGRRRRRHVRDAGPRRRWRHVRHAGPRRRRGHIRQRRATWSRHTSELTPLVRGVIARQLDSCGQIRGGLRRARTRHVNIGLVLVRLERLYHLVVEPRVALGEEGANRPERRALRHEDSAAGGLGALRRASLELLLPRCAERHLDHALCANLVGGLGAAFILTRLCLAHRLGRDQAVARLGPRRGGAFEGWEGG